MRHILDHRQLGLATGAFSNEGLRPWLPLSQPFLLDVHVFTSWEEIRTLRRRFGLFDVAIPYRAGPRNAQISSHETSKFTHVVCRFCFFSAKRSEYETCQSTANLQKRSAVNGSRGGFSNDQWLCCS